MAATKGPVANSGESGTKRGRISSRALFYNGRHVTPRGCLCLVKQDHQFLNKISTKFTMKEYKINATSIDNLIKLKETKLSIIFSSDKNCHISYGWFEHFLYGQMRTEILSFFLQFKCFRFIITVHYSLLCSRLMIELKAYKEDESNAIPGIPGLLAGPSGIRLGWGIEINGRFEPERPPTSVGPPSGGRTATFVPYV